MDIEEQAPPCYSMDGLLQSLQSEMKLARTEGCRLAKTMWNMYSAFEGVVGDISTQHHQESQFFKCEKRHSMIAGRPPPVWKSQGNVYIAMSPTCHKSNTNFSASPNYDIRKQLSVSNPVLPNCHTNDISTLLKKCQISDELTEHDTSDEFMSEDYICQDGSQYSDWITDEMSQLRADNVNSLLKGEECKLESESGISSGYNTRECTPVGYREEEIELMNERYNNLLDCKESIIEEDSNIDEVCDNLYENLKQFDSFLNDSDINIKKTIIPNQDNKRFFTQLCGTENPDDILQLDSETNWEDPVEELKDSVAKLNLDRSHVDTLRQICGYNSPKVNPVNSCPTECQFGSPVYPEHMDDKTIEELELDAEVAYIMSRTINQQNKESRKRSKVSDFHRATTTRRPSMCSDSTDSGRGSWVSHRAEDSKPNSEVKPRGDFGSAALSFKPVGHVYETIPGEDCATPVPWSHIQMENLTETNVDDLDDKDSLLDNTYASLNVSQMLDEFRPATPPQLPSRRRMPKGHQLKANSVPCAKKQSTNKISRGNRTEGNPSHQQSVCHKLSPGLPKYDEVIASDGHHTYTIADVLESVDNFAGHLPKARENLYSLVRNKRARRRLSECLKTSPVPIVRNSERLLQPVENHGHLLHESENKTINMQREVKKLSKSRSDEFQSQFDNDELGVSVRKTYKRSRRSLPNHPVTESPGQPTKTLWNYDLLKSHAIFC